MSLRRPTAACLCVYLSFISPLCGVAQTPDCGILVVYLPFISPFCGVAQTPDCGIVNLFATFRGVILDTRSVHFFYFRIARPYLSLHACMTDFFCLLHGRLIIINVSEYDYLLSYYTRVLNVCEYIETYSLACPWLLSWLDFRAWR